MAVLLAGNRTLSLTLGTICFADLVVTQVMSLYSAFISLAAGLSVGLSGLAAGFAVGVVGDAGVRGSAQQPRLYVGKYNSNYLILGMILILIFAEVLVRVFSNLKGLYGLIVALILNTKATTGSC